MRSMPRTAPKTKPWPKNMPLAPRASADGARCADVKHEQRERDVEARRVKRERVDGRAVKLPPPLPRNFNQVKCESTLESDIESVPPHFCSCSLVLKWHHRTAFCVAAQQSSLAVLCSSVLA